MKLLIASDIHGDATCCRAMLDAFKRENAEKILILGDILYHGPRNDLPEGYAPMYIVMPVGGFLVLGCVLATSQYLTKRMNMKNMKKEAGK